MVTDKDVTTQRRIPNLLFAFENILPSLYGAGGGRNSTGELFWTLPVVCVQFSATRILSRALSPNAEIVMRAAVEEEEGEGSNFWAVFIQESGGCVRGELFSKVF